MRAGAIILAVGLIVSASAPSFAAADSTKEISAQRRARITVTPQGGYPGRTATRDCEAWLQPEYRASGTVITPQMRCWWR